MIKRTLLSLAVTGIVLPVYAEQPKGITLDPIGTYTTGVFDDGAAEIVAYDADTQNLFVINAALNTVDILDIADPTNPTLVSVIDVSLELPDSGGVNSVAVKDGLIAVAVENDDKQDEGWIAFYDIDGFYLNNVTAGALPDMVTFTHNGNYVLVANEGEPSDDYSNDPEGSITVVDLRGGVMNPVVATAGFTAFNGGAPAGIRITGPNASVAQDLEPEYIATSRDSKTAWVALQENNAFAIVDIRNATVTDLVPLGTKDHMAPGAGLDASNRDGAIRIANWPVHGLYMPDAIASFQSRGRTYIVSANEGDAREYIFEADEIDCPTGPQYEYDDGECIYIDEARIKDLDLDPDAFADALDELGITDLDELQADENLGRLKAVTTAGDIDDDGDFDILYSYGARSMSVWDESGSLVYDSGNTLEIETALYDPDNFNSTNDENDSFDNRSDDKGPEPEGVAIGKVRGNTYAFIGLERVGGIAVFDVTRPEKTRFVSYVNNRDFSVEDVETEDAGDLGPEGLVFISADDSPNGNPLLVVGNEVSGTTTIYSISATSKGKPSSKGKGGHKGKKK